LHRIVAWPSGNSSTKNHEDRPRGLNRKEVHVKQANLAYIAAYIIKSRLALSSRDEFPDDILLEL